MEDLKSQGLNPQALEDKPVVYGWMVEYITAFEILSSRRACGFSPNAISMQDILAYLQIYGASDVDYFVRNIIAMDATYLTCIAKTKPSNTKS